MAPFSGLRRMRGEVSGGLGNGLRGTRRVLVSREGIFAACLLVLALLLRLWRLGKQSLWMDEAFSVWMSSHPVASIFQILETDTHPPLFYLFLHAWMAKAGFWTHQAAPEAALRLPFALFGALNALLVYLLGREWFDRRTAQITGLFWAISFMALYAETQVRMYPMAAFLSLLSTLIFVRAARRPAAWKWAAYLACAALSLYTLYYTGLVFLAHVAYLAARKKWRQAVWISLAFIAILAPWENQFLKQFFNIAQAKKIALQDSEFLSGSFLLGVYYLFQGSRLNAAASGLGILGCVYGIFKTLFIPKLSLMGPAAPSRPEEVVQTAYWSERLLRTSRVRHPFAKDRDNVGFEMSANLLPLLLFLIPAGVVFGVGALTRQHIFSYRYLILFAPYFFLFLVYGLTRLPRSVSIPVFCALAAANLGLWGLFLTGKGAERQDWRGASKFLAAQVRPGDSVVVETFMSLFPMGYYLPNQFKIQYLPGKYVFQIVPVNPAKVLWIPVRKETPSQDLESICRSSKRQWLVLCLDRVLDPQEKILQWFAGHRRMRLLRDFRSLDRTNNIRIFLSQPR